MNHHRRGNGIGAYLSCIILFFLIMTLTPSAAAADTMFRADPQHTGVFDNGGITPTNTELWQFATGGEVGYDRSQSSPTVSNGVVYVGSLDNNLYAIDAVTGTEKWRFKTGDAVRSSPAVSNGVVYVGSSDYNLYAIDAVTGTEKWRFTTGGNVQSSPAVSNGVVYVGSQDNNLYAINAVTGLEKWRFKTGDSVESSPAVSNGVVYIGSDDNNLYAIGQISSTPITTLTAAPTPVPTIPHPDPDLNVPIIIIFGMLLLAGGGYGIYRMTRKPSGAQPSVPKNDKAIIPQPTPLTPPPKAGDILSSATPAKPTLALTLDQTQLAAGEWHKVGIQITNTGDAHANGVSLSFSDDFETRWIEPIDVKSGETAVITSGILPKKKGNIPLEISCSYKDKQDQPYQQKFRFWIDVTDRMTTTPGIGTAATPAQSPVSAFTPKPQTPKQLPQELSERYTESEFIGKGGFARVFKAKRKDGKYVAVKIPISLDASTGRSFIAEMQNWTKLDHPNIVRVFDYNIMPMPYFEMELCDGSLAETRKPVEMEEAAWLIFNVCEGLKFTHARKIIHRDLKPQNVLLKNGVPKISDWGLSRIISESTSTTVTSFTPYYAAPEQIGNKVKDERTDIWQLGVILYELVTGVLPFRGESMIEIGMNIATKDPIPPGELKPDAKVIDAVVMRCLEKDPAKRYPSVLELQKGLGLLLWRNYAEQLTMSVSTNDFRKSAFYCGDLVMINLLTGDIPIAYKYLLDLVSYSRGDLKAEAQELSEQIKSRPPTNVLQSYALRHVQIRLFVSLLFHMPDQISFQ